MSATALAASPPYGSAEWVEWRRGGIGASELPTIAGVNPYQGEYALALLKRGMVPAFEGNAATRWGHKMERFGIEAYQDETGAQTVGGMPAFINPKWPHVFSTLDGKVLNERIGVEVKATERWDTPPRSVIVQCYGQMGAAQLEAIDVVRIKTHGEPVITRIERDEKAVTDLMDLGEAWYVRYVLGDEMPPVDGSRETSRWLDTMANSAVDAGIDAEADDNQESIARMLRTTRETLRLAETVEARLVNELKASMVGGYALHGNGWRVSWKPTKERNRTDWKALAETLGAPPEVVAAWTTTEAGTRPFRVTFEEEEA